MYYDRDGGRFFDTVWSTLEKVGRASKSRNKDLIGQTIDEVNRSFLREGLKFKYGIGPITYLYSIVALKLALGGVK